MKLIAQEHIESAYAAQLQYLKERLKTKGIAGYKIAVAGKSGQQNMGLSAPLAGVLYADGVLKNKCTIKLDEFTLARIETEIGYRLNQSITQSTDAEKVKQLVAEIMPVFEVPDVVSDNPSSISVEELISLNTFGSHIVVGGACKPTDIDPNSIIAKLYHNDQLINEAPGTAAMNDQWEALSVALNLALEHGYSPKKGDIVITGALGTIFDLKKGQYFADYGALGTIMIDAI